ncbi:hypothetical protein AAFF_G00013100 [Aldrovandia affinis]|uniref:Uncharacterized protein n=1 Tax=Aldrovandia affinis TaxID=143900 RepID=A0AAD7WHB8_9TELE|nr:hypothetical protein AAFF_G00013100 [Aldrovandia affinis]
MGGPGSGTFYTLAIVQTQIRPPRTGMSDAGVRASVQRGRPGSPDFLTPVMNSSRMTACVRCERGFRQITLARLHPGPRLCLVIAETLSRLRY